MIDKDLQDWEGRLKAMQNMMLSLENKQLTG